MTRKRQGIKEYLGDDPRLIAQYAANLEAMKQQAEAAMGVQFGPTGTNGHLSASDCGKVGGAITKNVFLSFADAGVTAIPTTHAQQQHRLQ